LLLRRAPTAATDVDRRNGNKLALRRCERALIYFADSKDIEACRAS
jgi:hypothetical protein